MTIYCTIFNNFGNSIYGIKYVGIIWKKPPIYTLPKPLLTMRPNCAVEFVFIILFYIFLFVTKLLMLVFIYK